jgi:hypothetical protein
MQSQKTWKGKGRDGEKASPAAQRRDCALLLFFPKLSWACIKSDKAIGLKKENQP